MRIPSVMSHSFSQVPQANIPRSTFDRSCGLKTTFDAGYLVPIFVDEALPGDTFNLKATVFARFATPIKPIMDNMFLDTFFFAVPYRLVWSNWQKFNGERDNPDDTFTAPVPTMESTADTGYAIGSLHDYLGLPTGVPGYTHMSLVHRAYNLIYNEWFRDQNLQDSVVVDKDNGPDDPSDYVLLRRGKRHDYFTSCFPWPQKGDAVTLPLGSTAPVIGIGVTSQTPSDAGSGTVYESDGTSRTYAHWSQTNTSSINVEYTGASGAYPKVLADLSEATAATINDLREAFQVQKLLERDARGGTRYVELIKAHFGVTSPDARLQRPEYLGGGSSPLVINPVAQTAITSGSNALGQLAGFGTASFTGHGFTKSFTEHCIIIGLVCARADLNYQQGMSRMWSRQDRYDFYWPALSHIGEQAVLNKEIYTQGAAEVNPVTGVAYDEEVFGYQERYAEYRYKPSLITGKFRSADAGALDYWHLAQDFGSLPALGEEFIVENPPVSRVIAVNTEPHFLFDSYFSLKCARPMPVYSVPGLIDHF